MGLGVGECACETFWKMEGVDVWLGSVALGRLPGKMNLVGNGDRY